MTENTTADALAPTREVLSVADFTRSVKDLLESNLGSCWIRGEVSNLRKQSSGHIYFTLKDDRSQLSCVLFRGDAARQNLLPQEGAQIMVFGQVSVYEPRGSYQLIVRQVVADGIGALQIRFEELKKQLAAEGLFASECKRPLPLVPLRLAVVTSPTGAAIRDFISILKRRGWLGYVAVVAAKVQGEGAAADLVTALEWVEENRSSFDLVVVTRGGGSLEDLWPFNEEAVVRAIARRSLPLISAVGHEIDFTLADFAADVRAETPSAAAELISSLHLALKEALGDVQHKLNIALENRTERLHDKISRLRLQLGGVAPERRVESLGLRLDDLAERLRERLSRQLSGHQRRMESIGSRLALCNPGARIQLLQTRLSHFSIRTERAASHAIARKQEVVRTIALRLENSSIRKALQRGFVVTRRSDGSVITRGAGIAAGERIEIEYFDAKKEAVVNDQMPAQT